MNTLFIKVLGENENVSFISTENWVKFLGNPIFTLLLQRILGASLVAQLVKNPPAMQELLLLLSHLSRVWLCATP